MSDGLSDGAYSLIGVAVGAGLGWITTTAGYCFRKSRRAKVLASAWIAELEIYADVCQHAMTDPVEEIERPHASIIHEPDMLRIVENDDWEAIRPEFAMKMRAIEAAHRRATFALNRADDTGGQFARIDERNKQFTKLASDARELAQDLRAAYGLLTDQEDHDAS